MLRFTKLKKFWEQIKQKTKDVTEQVNFSKIKPSEYPNQSAWWYYGLPDNCLEFTIFRQKQWYLYLWFLMRYRQPETTQICTLVLKSQGSFEVEVFFVFWSGFGGEDD